MSIDWGSCLRDQLDWHWRHQLRPGLEELTDEEYLWEPVAGCWSVRPRGRSTAPVTVGGGEYVMDHGAGILLLRSLYRQADEPRRQIPLWS